MAGGCRRNQVERMNTMDLTSVDRVIQGPDAGVISDSMKTHPRLNFRQFEEIVR